ncbi:MAG TPA: hypothetical protein VGC77_22295 [Rhodopseudomonas sp.]|uniref:hypothetical protein n=1 Tax=Rhodopseudomonas sp. TaxID=1078 RepID=UPI002ED91893
MQRVNNQHTAQLIEFSAKIHFSSGAIKTLSTREAFLAFGDNSDNITTGVSLSWIFLIQFPHSTTPEKQRIRFDAFQKSQLPFDVDPELRILRGWSGPSTIRLIVEHTEITWGDDIFNHLSSQVKKVMVRNSKAYSIADRTEDFFDSGYTAVAYFSAIAALLFSQWNDILIRSRGDASEQIARLNGLADSLVSVNEKLDFLLMRSFSGLSEPVILLFFEFFLAVLLFIFANVLSTKLREALGGKTFIILNGATEKRFQQHEKSNAIYSVAIALGFAVNVAAAIFLEKLTPAVVALLRHLVGR